MEVTGDQMMERQGLQAFLPYDMLDRV